MFETDYSIAWTIYITASLCGLLVWCRLTRWMWRWLKEVLRLLVAVLIFTPTLLDPERNLYAPAIAITSMDMLFDMGNNAWRAVSDLVLYGLIGLGLYLVLAVGRWFFEHHQRQKAELAATEASNTEFERAPYARDSGAFRPSAGFEQRY